MRLWLGTDSDNKWMKMPPADYTVAVMKSWLREGEDQTAVNLDDDYKYLVNRSTDTQAFMFRKHQHIALVFRGSHQAADWATNFKFRMKQFAVARMTQDEAIPTGEEHRGFHSSEERRGRK